jgi:hypothetical protein
MGYRIRLDLVFNDKLIADKAMDWIKIGAAEYAKSLNEGLDNEEISFLDYEECGHDQDPPVPCVKLERWEIRDGSPVKVA